MEINFIKKLDGNGVDHMLTGRKWFPVVVPFHFHTRIAHRHKLALEMGQTVFLQGQVRWCACKLGRLRLLHVLPLFGDKFVTVGLQLRDLIHTSLQ